MDGDQSRNEELLADADLNPHSPDAAGLWSDANPFASRCARSHVLLACTKANSESRARVIVGSIAKPVAASSDRFRDTSDNYPRPALRVGLCACKQHVAPGTPACERIGVAPKPGRIRGMRVQIGIREKLFVS